MKCDLSVTDTRIKIGTKQPVLMQPMTANDQWTLCELRLLAVTWRVTSLLFSSAAAAVERHHVSALCRWPQPLTAACSCQ